MPGGRNPKEKTEKQDLSHLIYLQTGTMPDWTLETWEPQYMEFFDALTEILSQGNSIMIRPGSGGRAMGIAIWRGDSRPPAQWFYDQDELNSWAGWVLQVKAKRKAPEAAD